jgi:hypothetical protein
VVIEGNLIGSLPPVVLVLVPALRHGCFIYAWSFPSELGSLHVTSLPLPSRLEIAVAITKAQSSSEWIVRTPPPREGQVSLLGQQLWKYCRPVIGCSRLRNHKRHISHAQTDASECPSRAPWPQRHPQLSRSPRLCPGTPASDPCQIVFSVRSRANIGISWTRISPS